MGHSNVSIFVPHVGCPHRCAFCDQRAISGQGRLPGAEDVKAACQRALETVRDPAETEIAFFGGSFTAIPRGYMLELLEAAEGYVGPGRFRGIRCSTRPDCIDAEVLGLLKAHGAVAVELGAQSMDDRVLMLNERGHSAQDVKLAAGLIKEMGLELGLQMMIGLYGSEEPEEEKTFRELMELGPDTLRLYPTVILKNTRLGELFLEGTYRTHDLDWAVELCSVFLERAEAQGVRVIKCGLHASEDVERDMVGGYYHPAFRELCEGRIFRRAFEREIGAAGAHRAVFAVSPRDVSRALGHGRENVRYFGQQGVELRVVPVPGLSERYRVEELG